MLPYTGVMIVGCHIDPDINTDRIRASSFSCIYVRLGKGPKASQSFRKPVVEEGGKGLAKEDHVPSLRLALSASALDPNSTAKPAMPPAPPQVPKVQDPPKCQVVRGKTAGTLPVKQHPPPKINESGSEDSESDAEGSSDDDDDSSSSSSSEESSDSTSENDESSSSDDDTSEESSSEADGSSSGSESDDDDDSDGESEEVVVKKSSQAVAVGMAKPPASSSPFPPPPQPGPLKTPWSCLPPASVSPAWRFDALEPLPSGRHLIDGDVIAYRLLEVGPSMCPQVRPQPPLMCPQVRLQPPLMHHTTV